MELCLSFTKEGITLYYAGLGLVKWKKTSISYLLRHASSIREELLIDQRAGIKQASQIDES